MGSNTSVHLSPQDRPSVTVTRPVGRRSGSTASVSPSGRDDDSLAAASSIVRHIASRSTRPASRTPRQSGTYTAVSRTWPTDMILSAPAANEGPDGAENPSAPGERPQAGGGTPPVATIEGH